MPKYLSPKVVEDWVQKYARKIEILFGLEHWTISVVVKSIKQTEDIPTAMDVSIDADHNVATINIYNREIGSKKELKDAFEHELIHIVLSPYEMLEKCVINTFEGQKNDQARKMFESIAVFAAEQAQINVERLLKTIRQNRHDID
jgi:hypothetical protein